MGHHSPSSHRKHPTSSSWMVASVFFSFGAVGSSLGKTCLVGVKTVAFGLSEDASEELDPTLAREVGREVVELLIFRVLARRSVSRWRRIKRLQNWEY